MNISIGILFSRQLISIRVLLQPRIKMHSEATITKSDSNVERGYRWSRHRWVFGQIDSIFPKDSETLSLGLRSISSSKLASSDNLVDVRGLVVECVEFRWSETLRVDQREIQTRTKRNECLPCGGRFVS